jgi:hypothetical protein
VQGQPYFVRVRAFNQEGKGGFAAATSATGGASQAPMRVPGRPMAAALSVVSGTQLRVTWSPPLDNGGDAVTEYRLEYSTASDFSVAFDPVYLKNPAGGGPYTKVLSGLVTGQSYWVLIYAMNSQGWSAGQAPTPPFEHPRQLPRAPTAVRTEVTSESMITVSFEDPADNGGDAVTDFRIEWDVDAEFESTGLGLPHKGWDVVSAAEHHRYTINGLSSNTRYYVRVSAINAVGAGVPVSDQPAGVVTAFRVPGRPASPTLREYPGDAAVLCGGQVILDFAAPFLPWHGLACAGHGADAPTTPAACPASTTGLSQADGGSVVLSYVLQWSIYSDFRDITSAGGSKTLAVNSATRAGPFSVTLSSLAGDAILSGQTYYFRVSSTNAYGSSSYCSRAGLDCAGTPLQATASPSC